MNVINQIKKNVIQGLFEMRVYNATTGETIETYSDNNVVVNDSKEAVVGAISATPPSTNWIIGRLTVGEDVGSNSTLVATPNIAFNDNNPLADTIVRATGDFVADGYLDDMSIVVTGAGANNGTFTIDTVTATTITLILTDTLSTVASAGGVSITGTPSNDNPRAGVVTDSASTMLGINTPTTTVPFTIGYASAISVSFSTTIVGATVLAAYPTETTKIITSGALYTGNGKVFAYKRYPQKSVSALVNIDITWTLEFP